ncbi:MAG: hypothetical protein JJ866_17530 [Roseibium sp.]|uniref:hypothetical protein n=1 Tax=Roseibium sp. TaxID=1936156 RepID=UPI001B296934|nr:hypothetical protein [Roseibium sp.]MBO6893748.1 hypothetical protein [Roseibium sp.]MBO6928569.1 hypothetical protein [Roseibium sp.]
MKASTRRAYALLASLIANFPAIAHGGSQEQLEDLNRVPTQFHLDWKADTGVLTVTASTGCRSAHTGATLSDDLTVAIDQTANSIQISGSFLSRAQKQNRPRIGPTDCMGSKSRQITIDGVSSGTYRLLRDNKLVDDLPFQGTGFDYVIDRYQLRNRLNQGILSKGDVRGSARP